MPITVKCDCGNSYELKDEFARKPVKCPQCGAVKIAPVAATQGSDPAFARDRFLLRQKAMAINEKYYVWDESGKSILFVERPTYLLRGILALVGGLAAGLVVLLGLAALSGMAGEGAVSDALAAMGVVGFIVAMLAVMIALSPKRHVTFYRDDTKSVKLAEVLQDSKVQLLRATYTVLDHRSLIIARFEKPYIYNLFRKRWDCLAPNGTLICVAKEDSIVLSLLRRVLGPFFGVLRTNFIILSGSTDQVIGEFNRKLTLLDRYVLDLSGDSARRFDRRTMLALGVMLDTGERR
jgi:hypothetical protein